MQRVRWAEVWQRRLAQHYLSTPASGAELTRVVERLCGVHAQVQPSAELALAVRVDGLTQQELRKALWHDRTLVRTYGPRGTVHLFSAADLPLWLAALRARTGPRPANQQELETLPPWRMAEMIQAIAEALDGQCLTRAELAMALEARLGPWATEKTFPAFGGFLPRWQLALSTAAVEGVLAFGPPRGAQVTYVRLDQWVGVLPEIDIQQALREVFERYLDAYGPASHVEFARWFLMLPAAARALQDELEQVEVEGVRLWQLPGTEYPTQRGSRVHLLPQFDSYIVGSHPREQLIPSVAAQRLGRGDTAAPFSVLLVDGIVGGVWQRRRQGKRLEVRVDAFSSLTKVQREQAVQQAERLADFLGLRGDVSFGAITPKAHL